MSRVMMVALVLAFAPTAPIHAAPPEGAAKAKDGDRVVCQREAVIGSRAATRRVCMKRSELTKLQIGTRDGVADYLKQSTGGAPRP